MNPVKDRLEHVRACNAEREKFHACHGWRDPDDWPKHHKTAARNFLTSWCLRTMDSGIRVMHQMAKTLLFHAEGLLAWYDYPISTGPLEGTNNKIKTMRRQA
jgi:transposase